MHNPLEQVYEGMNVLDHTGDRIGTVDRIKMSDEDPASVAVEQVAPNPVDNKPGGLIANILETLHVDQVPSEMHDDLMRRGFIRVDGESLFAADRYVTPDQISEISGDNVILKVGKDALIRRR
ncbi:hypothetical protein [Mariluticola halotolerans]|uniref:hypothetical protein n=1 Tax=Mariluticola halotolerans TaxID=2909283 RepID=UPI0026E1F070|nr:hypothetical protein [Mariluticola halotolerans]UJQ95505.1 hypothetical protein L1P08_05830 [Mariluticola halotolerans]